MSRGGALKVLLAGALLLAVYGLARFVLLPYGVERYASRYASEQLGLALRVGDIDLRPFTLRVEARDVTLARLPSAPTQPPSAQSAQSPQSSQSSQPLLTVQRLVLDLDRSSLWRPGWTLSELALHGAVARVVIGEDGRPDWAALFQRRRADADAPAPSLRFEQIVVRDGKLTVVDRRRAQAASVSLVALDLTASGLATAASSAAAPGRYRLSAAIAGGGGLSAHGSLVLTPTLQSRGGWALHEVNVPAIWPLLRNALGVDLGPVAALFSASAAYAYRAANAPAASTAAPDTPPGASAPQLEFDALSLRLGDVVLRPGAGAAPLLQLASLSAAGGRFDLQRHALALGQLALSGGAVRIGIDAQGRLDWPALAPSRSAAAAAQPRPEARGARTARDRDARRWQLRVAALRIDGVGLHAVDHGRALPVALDIAAIAGHSAATVEVGGAAAVQLRLRGLEARLGPVRLGLADAAADRASASTAPLLAFDSLALAGGALDSAARHIEIERVAAHGGRAALDMADVANDAAPGLWQLLRATKASAEPADVAGQDDAGWRWRIGTLSVQGTALVLRHSGFEPPIVYAADVVSATLGNVAVAADAPMQLAVQLRAKQGGTLQAAGTVARSGASAALELQIDKLPLLPLQPLLAQWARVELRSGLLSANARLELHRAKGAAASLHASGSASLHTVRLDTAGSDERLLSWQLLQADGAVLDTAAKLLRIRRIELHEPGARLVIAADNSVNLGQVMRTDAGSAGPGAPAPAAAPFAVVVERIDLRRGVLDFADLGLVLPFSTRITQLRGSVVNIDTGRRERARVQASGEIGEFGSARVDGSLLPFAPKQLLDLDVVMDNVAIPPFSPYTATFAGRKVAEGKLWLNLNYHIDHGRLLGRNQIRLADFRLGDRVAAPHALDLPLDLAVALLTDREGVIRLSVPVRGDIGKPRVDVGTLLREAFASALKRLVAAPFHALARLFGGGDDDDLAQIEFAAGSDALSPPQREKLEVVGRAIAERPQLRVVVAGPYASQVDSEQLRRRAARRELAQALGEPDLPLDGTELIAFVSEPTRRALEALLVKYAGDQALAELRTGRLRPQERATQPSGAAGAVPAGPYEAAFERIVEAYPLPDAALQLLAARRAEAIRDYLIAHTAAPADRVRSGPLEAVSAGAERSVSATIELEPLPAVAQAAARAPDAAERARRQ